MEVSQILKKLKNITFEFEKGIKTHNKNFWPKVFNTVQQGNNKKILQLIVNKNIDYMRIDQKDIIPFDKTSRIKIP